MSAKKDDLDFIAKTLASKVKSLERYINNLSEEHERLRLTDEEASEFTSIFNFPIQSLKDSLEIDYEYPKNKYSMCDMLEKFRLKKLHAQKSVELENLKSKANIAKIECLLEKIGNIK
jgi:hypothetical protein